MLALLGCAVSHVRAHSPIRTYKKSGSLMEEPEVEKTMFSGKNSTEKSFFNTNVGMEQEDGGEGDQNGKHNRVMVVVNQSAEAKHALQWALTHTIHSHDTVLLLHVSKPSKQGGNSKGELNNLKAGHEILASMESMCQAMRPGVHVNCVVQQGKDKGSVIVEAAKQHRVSLLVLGQKRRSKMWRLRTRWSGTRAQSKIIKYCIHNSSCMTIAVRKKNRKHGGYLITTKSHKNFWLLA